MAKKIEVSKYEKNIMKAKAINNLASTLQYKLDDAVEMIKTYQSRLDEMEDNGEAFDEYGNACWRYQSTSSDLLETIELQGVIEDLFKALDKLM